MVTEGGLYILTLFDDFGGTYGKSHFGLGLETGLSLSLKGKIIGHSYSNAYAKVKK